MGDCKADGTLIELLDNDAIVTDEWIEYDENQQEGYCVPRTTNGAVVAIGFTFPNPLYTEPANMVIYDPLGGSSKEGSITLCVRMGGYVQQQTDGGGGEEEVITFDDTKITGLVDLTADFGSGETFAVPLEGVEATELETDIVCTIALTTFICGTTGVNNGQPRSDSYELGQDFRVCVDVEPEFQEDYKITDFTSVRCGNEQQTRDLVLDGAADELPVVDTTNVVGSSNLEGTVMASAQAIALDSVITAGFFGGDDETMMESFECSGSVEIVYIGVDGNAKCNPPPSLSSSSPTSSPSSSPTSISQAPSNGPSKEPSYVPSDTPSDVPSQAPSDVPTIVPVVEPTHRPTDVPRTCWTYQEGYMDSSTAGHCASENWANLAKAKAACLADPECFGIHKYKQKCGGNYRKTKKAAVWKFYGNWETQDIWSYRLDLPCTPTDPCWTYLEGYYDKGTLKHCPSGDVYDDLAEAQAACVADPTCFGINKMSHRCDGKYKKNKYNNSWTYYTNWKFYDLWAYRLDDRTCAAANSRRLNLSPSTKPRQLNSQEKEQSAAVVAVVASKKSASFATTIKLSTMVTKDSGTAIPSHCGTIMTITFSLLLALVSHFLCL